MWSSDFSTWNDVSADVLSFEASVEDLALGPGSFILTLNNEGGKYGSIFPSIGSEVGLHLGFRFKFNEKLLGLFRANSIVPVFDAASGDLLKISGLGLGSESWFRLCYEDQYPAYKADQILYDQYNHIGFNDLSVPNNSSASRWTVIIPHSGRPSFRDLVVELESNLDYSAYFDYAQKPAPLQFFSKIDSSKRLNMILKSILMSQENNILGGSEPRYDSSLKNYLTLPLVANTAIYFRTDIPNGRDEWTEDVLDPVLGTYYWWAGNEATILGLETDKDIVFYGAACIKGSAPTPYNINIYFKPEGSMYGQAFNADNEGVDQLKFMVRKGTSPDMEILPVIVLEDEDGHNISQLLDIEPEVWTGFQLGVGAGHWSEWDTGVGDFNGNIVKMYFKDVQAHEVSGTCTIWVDQLRFQLGGGYEQPYLQDSDSVSKYFRRDEELLLPDAFPYVNMKAWGDKILQRLSSPTRIVNLTVRIDPAQVLEDDEVTAASLLPGWLLQVDIPRWGIKSIAEGGVWWRILRTTYHWGEGGIPIDLMLQSTGPESPDNYSFMDTARIAGMSDPSLYNWIRSRENLRTKTRQLSAL